MGDTNRRELLAATGTCLAAFGAGCLADDDDPAGDDGSGSPDGANGQSDDLRPLERWVPDSGSEELLFHYRDLTALETYEDALQASVVERVPALPDGDSAAVVEEAADGSDAIDSVLRFGSEGVVGNVVVSGSFDPDGLETDGDAAVGEFETIERDGHSVAVAEETLVASPADGATLESILAAGVEGTDRRIETNENFAALADRIADATFCWGEYAGENGIGKAITWSLGAEKTTRSEVAVFADAERAAAFESERADAENVTVETDGTLAVATRTIPTEEYEYLDLFAERGSESPRPRASVTIDSDPSDRTLTVTYHSTDNADRLEVSDEHAHSAELTEVGETTTFEYEAGASGELTVIGVNGDTEAVVAAYSYSF